MASPQLEKGFTPLANELFEKVYQSELTQREMRIVFAVIRFTYGFHRKSAKLSVRFLSQATNITYRHTQETVSKLITNNILLIYKEQKGIQAREIQLNKDYDTWNFTYKQKSSSVNTDTPKRGMSKRDMTELDMAESAMVEKGMTERVSPDTPELGMSTHAQMGIKEIKKKTLKTNSCIGSSAFNFYENSTGNETKERILSNDGNNSVAISAIDQLGDSHHFRVGQKGDSSVPKSVNTRDDQFGQLTKTGNDQNSNTNDTDLVISSIDQKSNKERQKTTLNTNSSVCLIPDELKNLKGFIDVWKDWTDYRNEIKKPLTPIAIKVQLGKLAAFKQKGYDILEIINTSISNSWLDFYEPRENIYSSPGKGDKQKKEYVYDKLKDLNPDLPGWM